MIFLFSVFLSFQCFAAEGASPNEVKMSGVVRLVRENPVPQVFFNDLSGTFLIPDGNDYAKFYNAFSSSIRSKKPVNFTYNKKTLMIIDVEGAYSKNTQVYEDAPIDVESQEDSSQKGKTQMSKEEQKKSVEDFIKTIDTSAPSKK